VASGGGVGQNEVFCSPWRLEKIGRFHQLGLSMLELCRHLTPPATSSHSEGHYPKALPLSTNLMYSLSID
jgi:hypothetical protein